MNKLLLAAALLAPAACTHSIHLVHVSDFDPGVAKDRGKWITAKTEQFVIMGFKFDTEYVDRAYRMLQEDCRGGKVQGITTQFSTSHGFFSWTNKILMQGLCVRKA